MEIGSHFGLSCQTIVQVKQIALHKLTTSYQSIMVEKYLDDNHIDEVSVWDLFWNFEFLISIYNFAFGLILFLFWSIWAHCICWIDDKPFLHLHIFLFLMMYAYMVNINSFVKRPISEKYKLPLTLQYGPNYVLSLLFQNKYISLQNMWCSVQMSGTFGFFKIANQQSKMAS